MSGERAFSLKKVDVNSSELLCELCIQTFVHAYEDVHSKSDISTYCRNNYCIDSTNSLLSSIDTEAVIAYKRSNPAGFYVIRHHECPVKLDSPSSELKQIYVLSAYYGAGLGQTLFESAVKDAKHNQSKWLWLCVSNINYRAQAFYKKLGFSVLGQGSDLIVGSDTLSSSIIALNFEVNDV